MLDAYGPFFHLHYGIGPDALERLTVPQIADRVDYWLEVVERGDREAGAGN